MLTLILGKAGSGKTAAVIEKIHAFVRRGEGGVIMLVPEQYSHEAERELCSVCGDTMSLYAEVFSFTGLARRIASELGGSAVKYLDKGGRLLCMAQALGGISARLGVYASASRKAETQVMLLSAVDELKAAGISSDMLAEAAAKSGGGLGAKLSDLALILSAYDAVASNGSADPSDRLTTLASRLEESSYGRGKHIFIDGFTDFTFQERQVISALIANGADISVCLTVDDLHGDSEIYELSRRAAHGLIAAAKEHGVDSAVEYMPSSPDSALDFFADNIFSYSSDRFDGAEGSVELFCAQSLSEECELAAAKALGLVRDCGMRWRDIAVAVRGFEDYRAALESAFRHYGVPLFSARRSDLLSKPLPAMICGAYEIIGGGWAVDDVVSYMRCYLSGLDAAECDELENYIFKWQLRAGAWKKADDWHQHPDGYGVKYDDAVNARLENINALRRRLASPLLALEERAGNAHTVSAQAMALADFFRDIRLAETLEAKAAQLEAQGMRALAEEYSQLWDIIVSALEQCDAVLGDAETDTDSFGQLFTRMLSQYDVGTIPIALDRVSAGDFDRMRRRNIKCLIILGATDTRLPQGDDGGGIFSEDERQRLLELDIDLGGAGDSELWREFSLIYSCLTLPSDKLIMSYPAVTDEGTACRPSVVFNRAKAVFSLGVQRADMADARMSAGGPALSLAAAGRGDAGFAAERYFTAHDSEKLAAVKSAAGMVRGKLSPRAVASLYGKAPRMSASKADKFSSCKFAYFCQYGLEAKTYEPVGFKPPEIGTFMHRVLEMTAKDVKALGGFAAVSDETLREITDKWVADYVHTELNDFREKSARFIYLFKRICTDVHAVVADMAAELRRSDFVPLDFEVDFSRLNGIAPLDLGEDAAPLMLTGIADRIDGWVNGDTLYLRVVDYKTGVKKFSLSDIWYGMNMQMLLYLMTLDTCGGKLFESAVGKKKVVPAGVMYVPARVPTVSVSGTDSDDEIRAKREKELRRSGLVLDNEAVKEAWEHGESKLYFPVTPRSVESVLASEERLGTLFQRVKKNLGAMAHELHGGSIAADPLYRSMQDNACVNCDYFDVCHFADGENGEKCRFAPKLKPKEVWALLEGGGENG